MVLNATLILELVLMYFSKSRLANANGEENFISPPVGLKLMNFSSNIELFINLILR